ncbi:hypothetical protein BLA28_02345 [Eisenbergiella tayi]|nr:hypothetical protein BLA28_02345 [Eisenbergiella tayi]
MFWYLQRIPCIRYRPLKGRYIRKQIIRNVEFIACFDCSTAEKGPQYLIIIQLYFGSISSDKFAIITSDNNVKNNKEELHNAKQRMGKRKGT